MEGLFYTPTLPMSSSAGTDAMVRVASVTNVRLIGNQYHVHLLEVKKVGELSVLSSGCNFE
jgi:hypothetical protein